MASMDLSFDVKINIVRPYITKNLGNTDLSRINETTNLKYESLKTLAPQAIAGALEQPSEEEVLSYLDNSLKELDEIHDEFDQLAKKAEDNLKDILFTYDVTALENEPLANAERTLFGFASGIITFAKYKKLNELEQIVNNEIQSRMVENGGRLDGVA